MTRILTVEEVAEMLRLNAQVVRQYLRSGKLPGVKIGRHWRISEDNLRSFLEQNAAGSTTSYAADAIIAETAAKYPAEGEWKTLSKEEKEQRIKWIQDRFARPNRSSEDFMREKHEETEEEERRWEERHRR